MTNLPHNIWLDHPYSHSYSGTEFGRIAAISCNPLILRDSRTCISYALEWVPVIFP